MSTFSNSLQNKKLSPVIKHFSTYPQKPMCYHVDKPTSFSFSNATVDKDKVIYFLYTQYLHLYIYRFNPKNHTLTDFLTDLYTYPHTLLSLITLYKKKELIEI